MSIRFILFCFMLGVVNLCIVNGSLAGAILSAAFAFGVVGNVLWE